MSPRPSSERRRQRRDSRRLRFESLEPRRLLARFTVNVTGDALDPFVGDGICDTAFNPNTNPPTPRNFECSLRAAISEMSTVADATREIFFNIPGGGVPTINTGNQFLIGRKMTIDGSTQPGGLVQVIGPGGGLGFHLALGSAGSIVRGLVINGFRDAISLSSDSNLVVGNRIGTNPAGTAAGAGNEVGIVVSGRNNIVGGTQAQDRNVISGNHRGIGVVGLPGADDVKAVIQGNYVGTDVTGTQAIRNRDEGIIIFGAQDNIIGGSDPAAANVISGNGTGIIVAGDSARNNRVLGNKIGTDVTGTLAVGNFTGVQLNNAPANFIGGSMPGETAVVGNVISGNQANPPTNQFGYGVHLTNPAAKNNLIVGNKIGTDVTGTVDVGNSGDGVVVEASDNMIGGTTPAKRNVISGNGGDGVFIGANAFVATGNHVIGNLIGTDVTGTVKIANDFRGVHLDARAEGNTIGGEVAGDRNIISGNQLDGVVIALERAKFNTVKNNYIGTDITGKKKLGNGEAGVWIFDAPENVIGESSTSGFVRNVISGNKHGVKIEGLKAIENVVQGNRIGTDLEGKKSLGNAENGVFIVDAKNNLIGDQETPAPTSTSFSGNLISANQNGVVIHGAISTGNRVEGNLIGTQVNGQLNLGNTENGVWIKDAELNRIGSQSFPENGTPLVGNTISANRRGILIQGQGAQGNQIGGNQIGTTVDGKLEDEDVNIMGNLRQGIRIEDAPGNFIGGEPPVFIGDPPALNDKRMPGNRIWGNAGSGIVIVGATATGNVIQRNSLFSNAFFGIDLGENSVTDNDPLDTDLGPNERQNFPVLTAPEEEPGGQRVRIQGTLSSKAQQEYRVEIFSSQKPGTDDNGEGQFFQASKMVTTGADGSVPFEFLVPQPAADPAKPNERRALFYSATATDKDGNTSEFSQVVSALDLEVNDFDMELSEFTYSGGAFTWNKVVNVYNYGGRDVEGVLVEFHNAGGQPIDGLLPVFIDIPKQDKTPVAIEWDITDLLDAGAGVADLEIHVVVDPNNQVAEISTQNNDGKGTRRLDLLPVIRDQDVKLGFEAGGFYLSGVTLDHQVMVNVDWNGDLPGIAYNDTVNHELIIDLNGNRFSSHVFQGAGNQPFTANYDLGNDMARGRNDLVITAKAFSTFETTVKTYEYNRVDNPGWLAQALVTVEEAGGPFDKRAIYRAGIQFPEVATEGFFDVPVDQVSMMAGKYGPNIPRFTLRIEFHSNGDSVIGGEGKIKAEVGNKEIGEAEGTAKITAEGQLEVTADSTFDIDRLEAHAILDGRIASPSKALVPYLPFLNAQIGLSGKIDATLLIEDDENDELQWTESILDVVGRLEGTLWTGNPDGVFFAEGRLGAGPFGQFNIPPNPDFLRCFGVEVNAVAKVRFFTFEVTKSGTWRWDFAGGCSAPGSSPVLHRSDFEFAREAGPEGAHAGGGLPQVDYTYAVPDLAVREDGTMTLVYVDEDPAKPDGQQTEIRAVHFDGSQWSSPASITSDLLLDDRPRVSYDADGNAVATWVRVKDPITNPTGLDPATLRPSLEIAWSVRDAATGTWSAPQAATDNDVMDYLPKTALDADGNLWLSWIQDSGNDFPIDPDDATPLGAAVRFSQWTGSGWTAPSDAVAAYGGHSAPAFAGGSGTGRMLWSHDGDGDITTIGDREIRESSWDGSLWSSPQSLAGADDGIDDVSPQFVYDAAGDGFATWVRKSVPQSGETNDLQDTLMFATVSGGTFDTPATGFQRNGISAPRLLLDRDENPILVWQEQSNESVDLYYSVYERATSSWSDAIAITTDTAVEGSFSPYIDHDGNLQVIFIAREVEDTTPSPIFSPRASVAPRNGNSLPTFGSASLSAASAALGVDLVVNAIALSDSTPAAGSEIDVLFEVSNRGAYASGASRLAVLMDGVELSRVDVPPVAANETVQVTATWNVPLDEQPHTLAGHVDIDNEVTESRESNNRRSRILLQPDLIVSEAVRTTFDDRIEVAAVVANRGSSRVTEPFDVTLCEGATGGGDLLATARVDQEIGPGEQLDITLVFPQPLQKLSERVPGFVEVDGSNDILEVDEENNTAFVGLNPFTSWQNPFNALDTNADTFVSPVDALILINRLNASGAFLLPLIPLPPDFLDPNADGFLSAIDPLIIINFLNQPAPGGEGEAVVGSPADDFSFVSPGRADRQEARWEPQTSPGRATVSPAPLPQLFLVESVADHDTLRAVALASLQDEVDDEELLDLLLEDWLHSTDLQEDR